MPIETARIDYVVWPSCVPRPSFESICEEVLTLIDRGGAKLGREVDGFGNEYTSRKADVALARNLVTCLARRIRGMSYPEVTQALGLSSQSTLGCRSAFKEIANSQAGILIHNEVVKRLLVKAAAQQNEARHEAQ